MSKIMWDSAQQKAHEWIDAKKYLTDSKGNLLPNGTKFSRKTSGLKHSFIVIDNKILAINEKGAHLGEGSFGRAKLAEDEHGHVFALKVSDRAGDLLLKEGPIGSDLRIAGEPATRMGGNQGHTKKTYLAYKYLGTPLSDYLEAKAFQLSQEEAYDLSIKLALELHYLHTGKKSKTKTAYLHNDAHNSNIVIDAHGHVHFIDFGFTKKQNETNSFFNSQGKIINNDTWYLILNCITIFYLLRPEQKIMLPLDLFPNAVAKANNVANTVRESADHLVHTSYSASSDTAAHDKELEKIILSYHIELTALEVAATLTMNRFHLETFQEVLKPYSDKEQLMTIRVINSQSKLIFELYEQINVLYGMQRIDFEKQVKRFLVNQSLSETTINSCHELNRLLSPLGQNEDALKIEKCLNQLIKRMEQEKKLITYANSFNQLIHDILSFKKHNDVDSKNKLDALNSDLYEAGEVFFNRKYDNQEAHAAALKQFKETCQTVLTQAKSDFSDKPYIWNELKLVLAKIADVSEQILWNKENDVNRFDDLEEEKNLLMIP